MERKRFYSGLSVRNGLAGRPALLNRFGCAASFQAKRTALGCDTLGLETTTVSPTIWASPGTNLPSSPASVNQVRGCPSLLTRPPCALANERTALPSRTFMLLNIGP